MCLPVGGPTTPNDAEVVLAMCRTTWQKAGEFRSTDPKRTLKFTLYKLMCMCAVSCVCKLRPALNVPNVKCDYICHKSPKSECDQY